MAHQPPVLHRYANARRLLPIKAAHLSVRSLACRPRERVCLRGVSFDVERGELLSLVGPAGSGKSLLLRVIAGLDEPDGGRVYLDGEDITDLPPGRRAIRMAFPSGALAPHLPLRDLLSPSPRFALLRGRQGEALLRAQLELIAPPLLAHLGARFGRLPPEVQAQATIAWALLRGPRLLLLDDPLARVDQPLRGQLARHLKRLVEALGITTIYATLDQSEGLTIGHRIAVLNDGEFEQLGTAQGLQTLPRNLFVATWVHHGGLNLFTLRSDLDAPGGPVLSGTGLVLPLESHWVERLRRRHEVVVAVLPEKLGVTDSEKGALYRATVRAVEPLLWERRKRLHLSGPAGEQVAVVPQGVLAYRGMAVGVTFDLADALLFDRASGQALW